MGFVVILQACRLKTDFCQVWLGDTDDDSLALLSWDEELNLLGQFNSSLPLGQSIRPSHEVKFERQKPTSHMTSDGPHAASERTEENPK